MQWDRGVLDHVVKFVLAVALALVSYVGNGVLDRIRDLERRADESLAAKHALELRVMAEMASRAELERVSDRTARAIGELRAELLGNRAGR